MLRTGLSLLLGLSLLQGLWAASPLPGSPRAGSRPIRVSARVDVPAQALQQPGAGAGTGSAGLWPLLVLGCSCSALSLLVAALWLGCRLWRKAKRPRREEKGRTPSAWPRTCCLVEGSPLSDEGIGRQRESPVSIMNYLRHLRRRCLLRDVLQRGGNGKDLDEEAALFSD